jgi:CheY-like chemotaxis protein
VLNRHGYRVIETDSSATALALWNGQAPMVDLLLISAALPGGISGRELADRLQQTKPGLKVIYAAERNLSSAEQALAQVEGSGFIPKPLNPEHLVKAVQGFLG